VKESFVGFAHAGVVITRPVCQRLRSVVLGWGAVQPGFSCLGVPGHERRLFWGSAGASGGPL
jgi:hypothetical protein